MAADIRSIRNFCIIPHHAHCVGAGEVAHKV